MLALSAIVLAITAWAVEPSVCRAADSAEEVGLKIATEARERQKGFGNFTASLTMILRNKRGQESQRELRLKVIEVEGDGDRTLFVFDRPRDVRGTAFLVHAHKDESDEQWLYLPALKRVKRISSSKQSGSFMGSEFSYEDLSAVEIEKFTHRHLRDESCGELECTVLERIPLGKDSGYSRQLVWLDQEELRTMQVHFFGDYIQKSQTTLDRSGLRSLYYSHQLGDAECPAKPTQPPARATAKASAWSSSCGCSRMTMRPGAGSRNRYGRKARTARNAAVSTSSRISSTKP